MAVASTVLVSGAFYLFHRAIPLIGWTITGAFLGLANFAAVELLRHRRRGLALAFAVQVLQVVRIKTPGIDLWFLLGPYFEFGGSSEILRFRGGFGALASVFPIAPGHTVYAGYEAGLDVGFLLDTSARSPEPVFAINFVALALALRLLEAMREQPVPDDITT